MSPENIKKPIAIVASEKSSAHNPAFDVWHGVPEKHYDTPARTKFLLEGSIALANRGIANIYEPEKFSRREIERIHSPKYLDFINNVSQEMSQKEDMWVPMITNYKNGDVICYKHKAWYLSCDTPHGVDPQARELLSQAGVFSFDQSTPIMADTYDLVLESAYTAITAAQKIMEGYHISYALCRPPGHHAEPSMSGGYCYLNNLAVATQYLIDKTQKNIAVLDIDAHHGNGTELIFYKTSKVDYGSIHVDTTSYAPHYTGHISSKGEEDGYGYNHNHPLPAKTSEAAYLQEFDKMLFELKGHDPSFIVVSLGFDTYKDDPLSLFKLTNEGYKDIAKRIAATKLPVLVIQEGGYKEDKLGELLSNFLENLV